MKAVEGVGHNAPLIQPPATVFLARIFRHLAAAMAGYGLGEVAERRLRTGLGTAGASPVRGRAVRQNSAALSLPRWARKADRDA
jgi:hypothetical protein